MAALGRELSTYEDKKAELLRTNKGKYVLIKGNKIIGIFESSNDAINNGIKQFEGAPFLVKKIEQIEQVQLFTSNLMRVD